MVRLYLNNILTWIALAALVFGLSNTCIAQFTWSKRFHEGFPNTVYNGISNSNDTILVSGVVLDTTDNITLGSVFTAYDLKGNQISSLFFRDESGYFSFENFEGTFSHYSGREWINTGYSIGGGHFSSYISKVRFINELEFVDTLRYLSPFAPSGLFFEPRDFQVSSDKSLVILTEVQDSSYSTGYFVFKINQQGDTLWSSLLQTDNYEQAYSIEAKDEGFLIGGLRRIPDNSMVGHHSKNILIKLDSLGNKEWERFIPPEELSLSGVKDFILEGDGSIIIGTSIGIPQTFSFDYVNAWEPMICKLDSEFNLVWSRSFVQYHRWLNSFNKILKCKDSSGYLGCGLSADPTPDEPGGDINGYIVKASNDGDSLWRRDYNIVNTFNNFHSFNDMIQFPNGDIVLCGEARAETQDSILLPRQQGWLIKVDQHGCLVPGCHLPEPTSVLESEKPSIKLLLYPNPTSDILNVFIRNKKGTKEGTFHLYDRSGKQVLKFSNKSLEMTHLIPLDGLVNGEYFLSYYVNGQSVVTEKFIIARGY